MTIQKLLNPRNDLAFKRIFETERNKDILLHRMMDKDEIRSHHHQGG